MTEINTSNIYEQKVDLSAVRSREKYAQLADKFTANEVRTIRAVLDDERVGWTADAVREAFNGRQNEKGYVQQAGVYDLISQVEDGNYNRRKFEGGQSRLSGIIAKTFREIGDIQSHLDKPDSNLSSEERSLLEARSDFYIEQLDALMILDSWMKAVKTGAEDELARVVAERKGGTKRPTSQQAPEGNQPAENKQSIKNEDLNNKFEFLTGDEFAVLPTGEKIKKCDELKISLLLEMAKISKGVKTPNDAYSAYLDSLRIQLQVVETIKEQVRTMLAPENEASEGETEARSSENITPLDAAIDYVATEAFESMSEADQIKKLNSLQRLIDAEIVALLTKAVRGQQSRKDEKRKANLTELSIVYSRRANALSRRQAGDGIVTTTISEASGSVVTITISETPVVTHVQQLVTESLGLLQDPDYDPRSDIKAVVKLSDELINLDEYLTLARNENTFLQVKAVRKTVEKDAKELLEKIYARAEDFDRREFESWEADQRTQSVYLDTEDIRSLLDQNISTSDLAALTARAVAQIAVLNQDKLNISNTENDDARTARVAGLDAMRLYSLRSMMEKFYADQINLMNEVLSRNDTETFAVSQKSLIRTQLASAMQKSSTVIVENDPIKDNFSGIFDNLRALEARTGRNPELSLLETEVLSGQFTKYQDAYLTEMYTLEKSDMSPSALGNESKRVIDSIIFGAMSSLIVEIAAIDQAVGQRAKEQLGRLHADHGRRMAACFNWVGGARDQLVNGSPQREGARGVIKQQNTADLPLTGSIVREDLNDTSLEGIMGTNAKLGSRSVSIPAHWRAGIDESLILDEVAGANDTLEITYTETAMERVWRILDDLYEGNLVDGTPPVLVLDGRQYPVPTDEENKPLRAGMFHNQMAGFIDFIYGIEVNEARVAGQSMTPPVPNLSPRFTREFIARAIKSYVMTTWNHIALSPGSIEGMSDYTYYALDWLKYAADETFKYKYAKFNIMTTAFLFGYANSNPWKMFKPDAIVKVKEVVDRYGDGNYDYLLNPLITLVNTSRIQGRPHFPVFSPPLRTTLLGKDAAGRRLRHRLSDGSDGLLLTIDDIRDNSGRRIYGLMPVQKMPGTFATIAGNFGQNAIDGMLQGCLMKDVSDWDSATILSKIKKDARYATSLFPKIGMEIEAAKADGNAKADAVFLNRISVMLVLVKILNMAMPKEVLRGQGKDLDAVRDYLTAQVTANVITSEDREILYKIATGLFQWDIFSEKLADEFIKQMTMATYFGGSR